MVIPVLIFFYIESFSLLFLKIQGVLNCSVKMKTLAVLNHIDAY